MAISQRGKRYEISQQLDDLAIRIITEWTDAYRKIWNCKVAEEQEIAKSFYKAKEEFPTIRRGMPSQAVAYFAVEHTWLKKVASQIRRNAGTKFVEALHAYFKGLRNAPRFKSRFDKQNCLVTNELFDVKITGDELFFSLKKTEKSEPFCTITVPRIPAMIELPKMIWLRIRGKRLWISFSYSIKIEIRNPQDIIDELAQLSYAEQEKKISAIDLGIIKVVATSEEETYGFTHHEEKNLARLTIRIKKLSKKLVRQRDQAKKAKRSLGSNYYKTLQQFKDAHATAAYIRENMRHRISKQLADKDIEIMVGDPIGVKSLMKRPKAKKDPITGKWLRNGRTAKSGLARGFQKNGLGSVKTKLKYKLRERDKLLIPWPQYYSSQECSDCGYICSDNRKTQKHFICMHCEYSANADHNAAKVQKNRLIKVLRSGNLIYQDKLPRKISVRKNKAARTAVSICGAEIRPDVTFVTLGTGAEAETSGSNNGGSFL